MVNYDTLRSELKNYSTEPTNDNDRYWSELNELVLQVLVPEKKIIDSRPFEREDFAGVPEVASLTFKIVRNALSCRNDLYQKNIPFLKLIYSSVILCGEHSKLSSLWTNPECFQLSQTLLNDILKEFQLKSLNSFFVTIDLQKKQHGSHILGEILPKLSKNSWKYYPAAVQCYSWLLHELKQPNTKYFLHISLPVSLNILNDYQVENKIIALNCLRAMISNVSKAELHWHIEVEVLHKILKPLFYYREFELILPLVKCTIEIADKSTSTFKDIGVDLKWSFFDEILSILLPMMEYEQDMQRRSSYIQSLLIILERSNLAIGRWSLRILQIIEDYAKTPATELEVIMVLNLFIRKCWPLITHHWRYINLISGKIIYRSSNIKAINESKITLELLKELLPKEKELIDAEYIEKKRSKKK